MYFYRKNKTNDRGSQFTKSFRSSHSICNNILLRSPLSKSPNFMHYCFANFVSVTSDSPDSFRYGNSKMKMYLCVSRVQCPKVTYVFNNGVITVAEDSQMRRPPH